MDINDLDQAVKLKAELLLWRQAQARARREVFKAGELVVTDAGHGYQGQQAQTKIALDLDVLAPIIEERIAIITARLRDEFGVEV